MNSDMDLLNKLGALGNLNPDHVQGILSLSSNDQSFIDHHQQPLSILNFNDNNFQVPLFYEPITPFLPSATGPRNIQDTGVKTISETDYENAKKNYRFCGKKRKRSNEREVEKPKEFVHVRAKRGQATDSHSLAERLRREKINEKLRGLQDLVPGCYKTMGMAVMLDVIINYVRSLQNQIEFLSMKLSVASLFYDFNSETDGMETLQGTTGYEAQGMELGEGYGGFSYFPSAWPET